MLLQGWPDSYFQQPLVTEDKADGIFWWGVDTTQPQNSMPGFYEQTGTGCCYERDRHTRLEPKSLEYLLRCVWMSVGNRILLPNCTATASLYAAAEWAFCCQLQGTSAAAATALQQFACLVGKHTCLHRVWQSPASTPAVHCPSPADRCCCWQC